MNVLDSLFVEEPNKLEEEYITTNERNLIKRTSRAMNQNWDKLVRRKYNLIYNYFTIQRFKVAGAYLFDYMNQQRKFFVVFSPAEN